MQTHTPHKKTLLAGMLTMLGAAVGFPAVNATASATTQAPAQNTATTQTPAETQQAHAQGQRWDAPAQAPAHSANYTFIYQYQGQSFEGIDCGPATVLMALDHAGKAPDYFTPQNLAGSLQKMRAEAMHHEPHGTMYFDEVMNTLTKYGLNIEYHRDGDVVRGLEHIKAGKRAVAIGQTGILGPENDKPGFGHYVYISGYDAATNSFEVGNPLNPNAQTIMVSEELLQEFLVSNLQVNPAMELLTF